MFGRTLTALRATASRSRACSRATGFAAPTPTLLAMSQSPRTSAVLSGSLAGPSPVPSPAPGALSPCASVARAMSTATARVYSQYPVYNAHAAMAFRAQPPEVTLQKNYYNVTRRGFMVLDFAHMVDGRAAWSKKKTVMVRVDWMGEILASKPNQETHYHFKYRDFPGEGDADAEPYVLTTTRAEDGSSSWSLGPSKGGEDSTITIHVTAGQTKVLDVLMETLIPACLCMSQTTDPTVQQHTQRSTDWE